MKNKLINIFLILALVAGLSLLLYPTVSDYWNSLHASQAVASYDQAVKSMDEGKYDELLQRAGQYNRDLFLRGTLYRDSDDQGLASHLPRHERRRASGRCGTPGVELASRRRREHPLRPLRPHRPPLDEDL